MKPARRVNAAFVGVESHFVYTKSSAFFIEVLQERLGGLRVFPSDWRWIHFPLKKQWDLVVFWQHFPEPWELDALGAGSVALVPMLDNCPKEEGFWKQYRDCKVLCFSRTLGELLRGFGLNVLIVQYFPPVPQQGVDWGNQGLKAFFWPRKEEVGWPTIRPLLSTGKWSGVHLHVTNNLSEVPLDVVEEDEKAFKISTSTWFDSVEDYRKLLRQHQVFFAPRRQEGIGLSFLEALSLGMAVISPDNATMNEYIRSGVNGYLYDPDRPMIPSWRDAARWGSEARRLCATGRERWVESIPAMIDFLLSGGAAPSHSSARSRRPHDPRVAQHILRAWPGYIRYSVWKALLKLKRLLFPHWKSSARSRALLRD